MAVFSALPAHDGAALLVLRLVFGSAMIASIVIAFVAIRGGDVRTHSAWMTRAYAIGAGAGTQVFTLLVGTLIAGPPDEHLYAVLMGAAWVINLVVAEIVIRRRAARARRVGRASGSPGHSAQVGARLS